MKRSQLKRMIEESIIEMLPEIIEIITENIEIEQPKQKPQLLQTPDLTLIRQHAKAATGGRSGYDDLPSNDIRTEVAARSIPAPSNPKAVIGGEVFASGKGIIEWYSKQSTENINSELNVSNNDMNEFMRKRFGIK